MYPSYGSFRAFSDPARLGQLMIGPTDISDVCLWG